MKKLLSFVIVLSLCIAPFNGNSFAGVRTQALNIPIKADYSSFSNKERLQIDTLSSISNNSPLAKATYINEIQDVELYKYCLKETLDTYYGNIDKFGDELSALKKTLSSKADDIIEKYEIAAEERATAEENGYSPTEVLVSFEPGTSIETIETIAENIGNGYEMLFSGIFEPHENIPESRKKFLDRKIDYGAIATIDVDLDKTTAETIEEIEGISYVESCSRNHIAEPCTTAADVSGEPYAGYQYYLDTINMVGAWDAISNTNALTEIYVAVLDSGLDLTHEDVTGNFYNNYSVDITKSGYPKLSNSTTTHSTYHGTSVWGVIRATPKNNKGITGMYAPLDGHYSGMIKVMAVKMTRDNDVGIAYYNDMANAIKYAVEAGASVINISFAGQGVSDVLYKAVKSAYDQGVTIVAAAGNDSDINATEDKYIPACYSEVISVAATDENDQMWYGTNNNNMVDICAPGSNIFVLDFENDYNYDSGTSYSAPMVAGAVAMMKSIHDVLTPSGAKNVLQTTETSLSDPDALGHGLLNVGKALSYCRYLAMRTEQLEFRSVVLSNSNKAKLRWNDMFATVDGFTIYRSTSQNSGYSAVKRIEYEDTLIDEAKQCFYCYDNTVQSGKKYYYKIRPYVNYNGGRKYANDYSVVKSITIP